MRTAAARPLLLALLCSASAASAQLAPGALTVRARSGVSPIADAIVRVDDAGPSAETDERGEARFQLPAGDHAIHVERVGFEPLTVTVTLGAAEERSLLVPLRPAFAESEVVVATSTRSGTILEDQPIRIEAVPAEEIEENLTVSPGDARTLLNELAGVRVAPGTAGVGGAGLRLRGLPSRYTLILLDDLPLLGDTPDPLALLQIPPVDLARVEVVKGAASALYGASALAGVLDLVSRRPGAEPEALVARDSLGRSDASVFWSQAAAAPSGFTLTAATHRQGARDRDGDGWLEIPEVHRWALRPRMVWEGSGGRSLFATLGTTFEDRASGTTPGAALPTGVPWLESARSRRQDAGAVLGLPLGGRWVQLRACAGSTRRERTLGPARERDRRSFAHLEGSLTGTTGRHTWVAGTAFDHDRLRSRERPDLDFGRSTPAIFVQDEVALSPVWSLAGSARAEHPSGAGSLLDGRLSALAHLGGAWSMRASLASGHALPTPLVEETETVGLLRVQPAMALSPERGHFGSVDLAWRARGFEAEVGTFTSEVRRPLILVPVPSSPPGALVVTNAERPLRIAGAELLLHATMGPVHLIVSDGILHGTESMESGPASQPITGVPRHSAEVAAIVEDERRGRIGFEASYTGRQRVEDSTGPRAGSPYWDVSFLAEARLGEFRLFVNALNLADVRQTDRAPFLLPTLSPTGRPTTEVWAPLEGRYFNAGLRVEF